LAENAWGRSTSTPVHAATFSRFQHGAAFRQRADRENPRMDARTGAVSLSGISTQYQSSVYGVQNQQQCYLDLDAIGTYAFPDGTEPHDRADGDGSVHNAFSRASFSTHLSSSKMGTNSRTNSTAVQRSRQEDQAAQANTDAKTLLDGHSRKMRSRGTSAYLTCRA
jgi:hypothetical protein